MLFLVFVVLRYTQRDATALQDRINSLEIEVQALRNATYSANASYVCLNCAYLDIWNMNRMNRKK